MARINSWNPEDVHFWESEGKRHAKRNLWISVLALMLAFVVWQIWSVTAVRLNDVGFNYTKEELFTLAALPGLSGATMRIFFTFMPGIVGGRNWTVISTGLLLVPAIGIGIAVQNPDTPFMTMAILAVLCGIGGGNFSSSMANISNFFPKKEKGTANGINGGLGNLGVSLVQFVTPVIITVPWLGMLTGTSQKLPDGTEIFIQNAAFVWVLPILLVTILAFFGMDNLPNTKQSFKEQSAIFKEKHMWIMAWLYTMCFGSFIGYAAAFPLLINASFPEAGAAGLAFLGPLIGAAARPIGGWISDKIESGAKVTFYSTILMIVATIGVIFFLQTHSFIGFLLMFITLFLASGIANGSTFQMVPFIFTGTKAKLASPVIGFIAAIAAYGAFIIPKIFGWSLESTGSANAALYLFLVYYAISLVICWYFYYRKNAEVKC
ncbi:MFS transporter [Calidifontibacillus erzurumensis]|uniref:MFS transporter n=1 Tax=Calidifontibacillus erzurumensis TaxID=2741433 RepID=A0A8J8GDG8_9BACI|nr:MFS transporter [Calidifontibacillus erzurumensis]NSL51647.1 MFS transporter [Calidifontibacillus erzurumensis]